MAISTDSSLPENRVKISEDLRSINVPSGEQVLGCVGDAWVRRVWFDMPRYCDGTDLSGYDISVNYRNKDEDEDRYVVQDATTGTDTITFSWLVGPIACAYAGLTSVSIKAQLMDGDTVEKEFNSTTYFFRVLPANTTDAAPLVEYSDAFTALMLEWQSQVDTATEQAEQAAEAITDGGYVPGLLAGAADSLMQDAELQDAFTQREVPDGADGVARIESIHGNTVVFNQLANVTGAITANTTMALPNGSDIKAGNKYLFTSTFAFTSAGSGRPNANVYTRVNGSNRNVGQIQSIGTDTDGKVSVIFTSAYTATSDGTAAINDGSLWLYFYMYGATASVTDVMLIDLTRMFGTGNEPATVAEFEAMFPDDYYPYDAGSLLSVNIEGVNDREIPVSDYFPDGLKSAGSAYDELTAGKAVKRVGEMNLAEQTWYWQSAWQAWYTDYNTAIAKGAANTNIPCNVRHAVYTAESYSTMTNVAMAALNQVGLTWQTSINGCRVVVRNGSDTEKPSGTLYYELAEPVETEISDPLNMCYRVETGGTEALAIPTGELSAPAPMVIAYGDSPDGLRDKTLAVIAAVENGVASTNYAVGAYLVHNGNLYRVTSAIATGEAIAPGTNCVACTVMGEVIRLTA